MFIRLLLISLVFLCFSTPRLVKAVTISMTTKEFLNFEVLDVTFNPSTLTLSGWAFINENQHFKTTDDHRIQLEFISLVDSFIVEASLTDLSMTSSYQEMGLDFCPMNQYYSSTCNYYYENVGFQISIPLNRFTRGVKYSTNIIVLANDSHTYLKTPLYYPIEDSITFMEGDYRYSLTSKLFDTNFRIIETPVYARNAPTKTGTIWTYGSVCSTSSTNKLYFKFGSLYTNILERYLALNQTYYRVKANPDSCVDNKRRIVEGTLLSPVWISGMFVEYSGSPLEINSILINTAPVIIAKNVDAIEGPVLNLLDYAKSYDTEDGDISDKIIVKSSNYQNRPGIYRVTYYVEDQYGYSALKTITVTIRGYTNEPPKITANNQLILQNSVFDYFNDVTAFDKEDGDITYKVNSMNLIDVEILGDQELCYKVSDSKNATTIKCITVTVFSNLEYSSQYRFISKNNLFYKENIPAQWISAYYELKTILFNETKLISAYLNP